MSWISALLGKLSGNFVKDISDVVDKFHLSGEEKQTFSLALETLLQKRDSETEVTLRTELAAKERVLVAELQQGDAYTKRARPTVVYFGLVIIFINYSLVPIIGALFSIAVPILALPTAFWAGWSGIVATWSIGRSLERRGIQNKVVSFVTGSKIANM